MAHAECHLERLLTDAHHNFVDRPIELLRHQSAGLSNPCMKPVQSLFSLVSNARATSGSWYRRSQVMLTVTFARLLVLRSFPRIFEEKRDCSQSRPWRPYTCSSHDQTFDQCA